MVGESVIEEVPVVLSIDRIHGNQVGRWYSVSKQFKTHSWNEIGFSGLGCVGLSSARKSHVSVVTSFEDSSVTSIVSNRHKLYFSDITNRVNVLLSLEELILESITNPVHSGRHAF